MHALLLVGGVFIAVISAAGVSALVRVARRGGDVLDPIRREITVQGALMALAAILGLLAFAWAWSTIGALVAYVAGRAHLARLQRLDPTPPGPQLDPEQVAKLERARRWTRFSAIASVFTIVALVPMVWLTLDWRWAVLLLLLSLPSLYSTARTLPRLYDRTERRMGRS